MTTLETNKERGTARQRLRVLRFVLLTVFLLTVITWPLVGLNTWHLLFFLLAAMACYWGFSRLLLPLMFYFPLLILYWVIAPAVQNRVGVTFYSGSMTAPSFSADAFFFCAAHIFGIALGVMMTPRKRVRAAEDRSYRLSVTGMIMSIIIMMIGIYFAGLNTVFSIRSDQESIDSTTRFIINFSKVIPAFICMRFILNKNPRISAGIRIIIAFIIFSIMIIVSNPFNTPRFLSLFGALIVVLSYFIASRKIQMLAWLSAFVPVYAVGTLALTSLMRLGIDGISIERIFLSLQSLEFSSYSVFIDALNVKFDNTIFFLSHIFILFPRSLWPDKADSIGIFVAEQSGYIYNNVGLIAFFNPFADYGYLALIAFSSIFGALVVRLNPLFYPASFRSRGFVYGLILTALTPMMVRGDLSTVIIGFSSAMLAYECVRLCTRFTLSTRREP